ncbi:MAG TPA: Crp/Fnr family transcriptional regulator [Candidatus Solibacter sp.]|jgi:CRP/FNR family cyclic AMP-dependent transcriptional regulator|nr:Crp/Fnr family transcriptional regulator [Candidatus Solibacter sp.]
MITLNSLAATESRDFGGQDEQYQSGAELDFLSQLPRALATELIRGSRRVTYARGAIIAQYGEALPGVVVDGLVRAFLTSPDGREMTFKYVRPGDAMGIVASFVDEMPPIGHQALDQTTVLYFDRRRFQRALANDAALVRAIARQLARVVVTSSDTAEELAFGSVRQRVAAHLLRLSSKGEGRGLVARVTQQELADAVGSVRQVVARALGELRAAGLIRTSPGKVVILDEGALDRESCT